MQNRSTVSTAIKPPSFMADPALISLLKKLTDPACREAASLCAQASIEYVRTAFRGHQETEALRIPLSHEDFLAYRDEIIGLRAKWRLIGSGDVDDFEAQRRRLTLRAAQCVLESRRTDCRAAVHDAIESFTVIAQEQAGPMPVNKDVESSILDMLQMMLDTYGERQEYFVGEVFATADGKCRATYRPELSTKFPWVLTIKGSFCQNFQTPERASEFLAQRDHPPLEITWSSPSSGGENADLDVRKTSHKDGCQ